MNRKVPSDDIFFKKYTVEPNQILVKKYAKDKKDIKNFQDIAPFEGGMYETFGEEGKYVLEKAKVFPNNVWTILDGDDGNMYIVTGYHWINRMGYLVTKEPWEDMEEEYICD